MVDLIMIIPEYLSLINLSHVSYIAFLLYSLIVGSNNVGNAKNNIWCSYT